MESPLKIKDQYIGIIRDEDLRIGKKKKRKPAHLHSQAPTSRRLAGCTSMLDFRSKGEREEEKRGKEGRKNLRILIRILEKNGLGD